MLKLVDTSVILDTFNSIYFIQALSDILDIEIMFFLFFVFCFFVFVFFTYFVAHIRFI